MNARIHAVGFASRPEQYLAAADIFCLPSYREGFGSVIIEAGAMNVPSVATRVTGVVDAVVEGETGLLVPAKDALALAQALLQLTESPEARQRIGQAAHRRAVQNFDAEVINQVVVDEYFRLAQTT
jgi:glycosyltransferase involved in cell wall biosynthesis